MRDYELIQKRIEDLVDIEEELRIAQDKVEDMDAHGRIEDAYDKVYEKAVDIYHDEFLEDVVELLDEIWEYISELEHREYRHISGYHIGINSAIIASQPDYEFIVDQALLDWELKFSELGFNWDFITNGRCGGWLLILSDEQLKEELFHLNDIIPYTTPANATINDFKPLDYFLDYHNMMDIINELKEFKKKAKKLVEFKEYVHDYIARNEKFYKAREEAPENIKDKLLEVAENSDDLDNVERELTELVEVLQIDDYISLKEL